MSFVIVVNFVVHLSSADEVHDLDPVALVQNRLREGGALEDGQVVLDGDPAWIDPQPGEQFDHRERLIELVRVAVERDMHCGKSICSGLPPVSLDRAAILDRFQRTRARTRALFGLIDESAYLQKPIPLRNPVVFYEGHLPAFAVNTLIRQGLGEPGIDRSLETVFARGIDPEEEAAAHARGNPVWPDRAAVIRYADDADRRVEEAILHGDLERTDRPLLRNAEALWTIIEHEEMHQETLAYMWHQIPSRLKRRPAHYVTAPPRLRTDEVRAAQVRVPAGRATLGTTTHRPPSNTHDPTPTTHHPPPAPQFAWDNERPEHGVSVGAFDVDVHKVTNGRFMRFVEKGGYADPRWWRGEDWAWVVAERIAHPSFWRLENGTWFWRGMFEEVRLPESWPVYVTWAEARAYARWAGQRLMSEAEFHRAAYGTPSGDERLFPWGDDLPRRAPSNFDFLRWDPDPVDAHPSAASAFGVHDLVGNGWEWTSDVFAPFAGFAPMASYPEYSADFFDGAHYVMKGASPVTARGLVRRGFRNWFRPRYPYVYATFRCVRPA